MRVVALGARPEQGEGIVTGDVVNTASRLRGAAPVDGIAVSEHPYRQTERIFDYEPLEPVPVKGKEELLPLFRPLRARARFGTDLTRTHASPLVGRELERQLLLGTFERAAQQRSCQLVTIVREPGAAQEESFTSWRRFCQSLAAERPAVLLFEDLHWADEARPIRAASVAVNPTGENGPVWTRRPSLGGYPPARVTIPFSGLLHRQRTGDRASRTADSRATVRPE